MYHLTGARPTMVVTNKSVKTDGQTVNTKSSEKLNARSCNVMLVVIVESKNRGNKPTAKNNVVAIACFVRS